MVSVVAGAVRTAHIVARRLRIRASQGFGDDGLPTLLTFLPRGFRRASRSSRRSCPHLRCSTRRPHIYAVADDLCWR